MGSKEPDRELPIRPQAMPLWLTKGCEPTSARMLQILKLAGGACAMLHTQGLRGGSSNPRGPQLNGSMTVTGSALSIEDGRGAALAARPAYQSI
jgi:hypothetical protein